MYKDSNFFFDCWLLSFPSTLSLILSFSRSLSPLLFLSRSFARSSFPTRTTRTHTQSFFLSSFLIHPFLSFSFKQILCHTLPLPLFLSMHLFLSLTRSHDRGQEVEVRELRSLDYCCVIATKFVSMTK